MKVYIVILASEIFTDILDVYKDKEQAKDFIRNFNKNSTGTRAYLLNILERELIE